ncbi:MAG: hypothetical protein ACFCU1_13025 [Sumerlaeia bacterium]
MSFHPKPSASATHAPPQSRPESVSRKWLLPDVTFIILLFILSIVWLGRASDPNTFWGDEVFSLRLAQSSTAELIERTSFDAHPPLYYLVLQATFWLNDYLGQPPDVLVGRTSGLVVLLFASLGIWWLLQPLAGRIGSAAVASLFALQPSLMDSATEMRNYAWEIGALGILFVLMGRLLMAKEGERAVGLWVFYTIIGSAALWAHLLAAIPLALLGVGWLSGLGLKSEGRKVFLWGGFCSQSLIILGFMPWLWRISHQTDYLDQVNLNWMTDPTVANLVRSVGVAFVFGRRAWYGFGLENWALLLGVLCFVVPLILMISGAIRQRWTYKKPLRLNIVLGLFGIFVWVGHIVILWLLARFQWVEVFHAPRYPALTSGIGCISLGLLLVGCSKQKWLSAGWVCLAAAPLSAAFLFGQVWAWNARPYYNSLWQEFKTAADSEKLPNKTEPLYFYPEEMMPFFPQLNQEYNVLPYSKWRNSPSEEAQNLQLAFFPVWSFHRHEALYLDQALVKNAPLTTESKGLSTTVTGLETPWMYMIAANGISPEDQRRLNSLEPRVPRIQLHTRKNQLLPTNLHPKDGWWRLMLDSELAPYRLGLTETLRLRPLNPLSSGNWRMQLTAETVGIADGQEVELTVQWAERSESFTFPAGSFELEVPLVLTKPLEEITLILPLGEPIGSVESPSEPGSIPKDDQYAKSRRFSMKFYGATFHQE